MSERATRPLNNAAVGAADDELYTKHAEDPRPNALYDEKGNRKPLSATDPDQAGLRQEWMDSYKANGGKTESTDLSGMPAGQAVLPCQQKERVNPLIEGDSVEVDESEVPELEVEEEPEEPEPPPPDEDEPEPEPDPIWQPMAKSLGQIPPADPSAGGSETPVDQTADDSATTDTQASDGGEDAP
jgi:hypothetical protein